MNMLLFLVPLLAAQDEKPQEQEKERVEKKSSLYVFDSSKGLTLRVDAEGKVEVKVSEEDEETGGKVSKTYEAPSVEECLKKYPEVVRKHGLGRYLAPRALSGDDFEKRWGELKKGLRFRLEPELPDGDFKKQMEELQKQFDELRRRRREMPELDKEPSAPEPPAPKDGRELGAKVEAVSETLREQLSLQEGEGVGVAEVKAGSFAEKAGLKKHDIILRVGDKAVTDRWQFRRDVRAALSKAEFDVGIIRGGKRQTLRVRTEESKEE